MSVNIPGEKRYEKVFGDTFSLYSQVEMEEFIKPFKIRFERNKLDAKTIFSEKKCFDAGCGNGRGTLFMLINGAAHVTAYDISEKNVESTKRFAEDFGFSNVDVGHGSLEHIPFEENTFDFVWCNGVIMHTEKPNTCLSELSRILKASGQAWIYVYGAGGVYWRVIYHIRELVKHINVSECIASLRLFRYETRYVAEFIDDWYATYLRTYTHHDFSRRLEELGFEKPELLKYGTDYDTSHRLNTFASEEEKLLMGEGDLRYLLTKTRDGLEHQYLINEEEYGSEYVYPEIITKNIDPLFENISHITAGKDWMKIAICAYIQRELRILLSHDKLFSMPDLTDVIKRILACAGVIKGL